MSIQSQNYRKTDIRIHSITLTENVTLFIMEGTSPQVNEMFLIE